MATYGAGYHSSFNSFSAYPNRRQSTTLPSFSLFSNIDPVVQKHLRKVYTSLLFAVLTAAAGSAVTVYFHEQQVFWPATLASFLTLPFLLAFYYQAPHSKWRAPTFYLFSFADGAAAAPLLSMVASIDARIPLIAFLGAAAVFACCSMSALVARRGSYLYLGSFAFTALMGIAFVSLISSIWTSFYRFYFVIYGGLLAFCAFVLYDTQMIIEKAHAGERDHLQHALDLLIDFIAIFKRLLIIMAKNKDERRRDGNQDRRRNARSE